MNKIVTIDPHVYNSLKNEYPEFGLKVEVYHHTELLALWIREGRIKFTKELNEVITYHDSCYLGRYNTVYDPPGETLKAIPGLKVMEADRNRENAMCCGAGGGLMWTEETTGTRIKIVRTEQLLDTKPTMIGSGYRYCLMMISDGVKAKEVEETVETFDIVEILEKAL